MRATTVLLAVTLAGCLYDEPLAPGSADAVDIRVLGAWRCVSPERADADPTILTVSRVGDRTYRAEFTDGEEEPTVFSAYAVTLGRKRLLNAQQIEDGQPGKWTLARYTLHTPTVLHIEFARDEPFRDITRKEPVHEQPGAAQGTRRRGEDRYGGLHRRPGRRAHPSGGVDDGHGSAPRAGRSRSGWSRACS